MQGYISSAQSLIALAGQDFGVGPSDLNTPSDPSTTAYGLAHVKTNLTKTVNDLKEVFTLDPNGAPLPGEETEGQTTPLFNAVAAFGSDSDNASQNIEPGAVETDRGTTAEQYNWLSQANNDLNDALRLSKNSCVQFSLIAMPTALAQLKSANNALIKLSNVENLMQRNFDKALHTWGTGTFGLPTYQSLQAAFPIYEGLQTSAKTALADEAVARPAWNGANVAFNTVEARIAGC